MQSDVLFRNRPRSLLLLWQAPAAALCVFFGVQEMGAGTREVAGAQQQASVWRAEHRIIDLHQHIDCTTQHLARAVKIMDAVGLGVGVNLSGGYVTRTNNDAPSEFERNKQLADRLFPGRFLHYMNLDYRDWDAPEFSARAVKQIEEGHRLGAAGFKE